MATGQQEGKESPRYLIICVLSVYVRVHILWANFSLSSNLLDSLILCYLSFLKLNLS